MNESATLVIGLGATGFSCIRHLAARERLVAIDTRAAPPFLDAVRTDFPEVEVVAAGDWPRALQTARRVVVSPGIPMDHCLVTAARASDVPLTSDVELFLEAVRGRTVIGVTGTNGKSTVTSLVGELLNAAGVDAGVGGNLGTPALDLLEADFDAYVLELSSFQLERLERPALTVGAVLNVSPDHLDRHASVVGYAASKRRIYTGAARIVYNAGDARTFPVDEVSVPAIAVNGEPDWRADDEGLIIDGRRVATGGFRLRGRHNHFNALAAAAVAHQVGASIDESVLARFQGLPHRSAVVAEVDGITYVDDSKATNVGACLAALEGFGTDGRNIVLIAGGDAKGASFDALAGAVERHVSHLVLLGRDADRIAAAVTPAVPSSRARDMRDAVNQAERAARPGDTVLLSPACASFDMYADFEARGDEFAASVRDLVVQSGEAVGP